MDVSSHFRHFIKYIQPTRTQREETDRQFTILKEQLTERIANDRKFHLEKIFRAGSTAKHTDLKDTFDIDLGVYYRSQGRTKEELNTLRAYTHAQLRKIYPPEKPAQDFHLGKNAVNLVFRTRKRKVDVVPIIRDAFLEQRNGGYIPRQDEWRFTSITHHINFVHYRTFLSKQVRNSPVRFNHLVRLMKWWNRRLPESLRQCSYFCELVTAAALEENSVDKYVTDSYQSSLYQIFQFLSEHAFEPPIVFNNCDAQTARRLHSNDLVIVLDAVNPGNNVTSKWDEGIKQGYLKRVRQTYNSIKDALAKEQAGDKDAALECWCKVFGEDFRRA
jgi:hypothetical protein